MLDSSTDLPRKSKQEMSLPIDIYSHLPQGAFLGTARKNISTIMAVKPDGLGTDIRSNDKMEKKGKRWLYYHKHRQVKRVFDWDRIEHGDGEK